MRNWILVLTLLGGSLLPAHAAPGGADGEPAGESAIEVIVAPDVPVDTLTVNQLRLIFSLRLRSWPNGAPIRVVTEPDDAPVHQAFCRTHLGVYANSLRIAWNRLIYTGLAAGPTVVSGEAAMLERVANLPGAIGYVRQGERGDAGVRTVTVTPEPR